MDFSIKDARNIIGGWQGIEKPTIYSAICMYWYHGEPRIRVYDNDDRPIHFILQPFKIYKPRKETLERVEASKQEEHVITEQLIKIIKPDDVLIVRESENSKKLKIPRFANPVISLHYRDVAYSPEGKKFGDTHVRAVGFPPNRKLLAKNVVVNTILQNGLESIGVGYVRTADWETGKQYFQEVHIQGVSKIGIVAEAFVTDRGKIIQATIEPNH